MTKTTYIADYAPGTRFTDLIVRRTDLSHKELPSGLMSSMTLRDSTECKATKFNVLPKEREILDQHHYLVVDGLCQAEERYLGQFKLDRVKPFTDAVRKEWFMPPLPETHEQTKQLFFKTIGSIHEPNLARLLPAVFTSDVQDRFFVALAAKNRHHAFPGGLLEHSVEVAFLCHDMTRRIRHLHRDLLVTAALLHDIGKIDEMDHDLMAGEYTMPGTLQGHITLGEKRVAHCAAQIDGFPHRLQCAISHMILSHHGRREYGAAMLPSFPEAYVLAECDLISARMNTLRVRSQSASSGQDQVYLEKADDFATFLFVGDLGLEEPLPKTDAALTFTTTPIIRESVPQYFTRLPIRGLVAAGSPEQSSEEPEEERDVTLPSGGADYLLRVTGDSMIGAGITTGDLLFVRRQPAAEEGDIVIAHLAAQGEVVKRLVKETDPSAPGGGRSWLKSENPDPQYAPILVDEETRIQGKVTGMIRDY